MTVLNARIQYLLMADMNYIAARLLLLSGNPFAGIPKSAEAIELLMKLIIMLEAKISRNEELEEKDLQRYGHKLLKLLKKLREISPIAFDATWDDYLSELQDTYAKRYPHKWGKDMKLTTDVDRLDATFSFLRTQAVVMFPEEEREQAGIFGEPVMASFNTAMVEHIQRNGGSPPLKALSVRNKCIDQFKPPWEQQRTIKRILSSCLGTQVYQCTKF